MSSSPIMMRAPWSGPAQQGQYFPRRPFAGVLPQIPPDLPEAFLQPRARIPILQQVDDGGRQLLRRCLVLQQLGHEELPRQYVGQADPRLVALNAVDPPGES